jgi:Putative stage IV sporulation protein YqfD.
MIRDFVFGYVLFSCENFAGKKLLRCLTKLGISARVLRAFEGEIFIKVPFRDFKKVSAAAEELCVELVVIRRYGLPYLAGKYRLRRGIPAGILMFLAINYILSCFVWTIDVAGNEMISSERIMSILSQSGIKKGSTASKDKLRTAEYALLNEVDSFSWVSLNKVGSYIRAEVHEKYPKPRLVDKSVPCDVVAAKDARIFSIKAFDGAYAVQKGEYVRAGDVLISKIVVDAKENVTFRHAMGEVLGEVLYARDFTLPLNAQTKVKTGKRTKYALNLFGFSVPLYIGGMGGNYELKTIENNLRISLFEIPIGVQKKEYTLYDITEKNFSEDEAKEMLLTEAARYDAQMQEKNIMSKAQGFAVENGNAVFHVEYKIIEEIGAQVGHE